MRRTKSPQFRKKIDKQDVSVDVIPDNNNSIFLKISIQNLSKYDFNANLKLFVEAYDRLSFQRIELGHIKDVQEEKIFEKELINFRISNRRKFNFRLKVVDPKTSKLIGFSEKVKEKNYSESLLPMELSESIKGVFEVDWDDLERPVLKINKNLEGCLKIIKPIIAESVFREILINYLLNDPNSDPIDSENNEWINYIKKYDNDKSIFGDSEELDQDEKMHIVNEISGRHSNKMKIVEKIKKSMNL